MAAGCDAGHLAEQISPVLAFVVVEAVHSVLDRFQGLAVQLGNAQDTCRHSQHVPSARHSTANWYDWLTIDATVPHNYRVFERSAPGESESGAVPAHRSLQLTWPAGVVQIPDHHS